MKPGLNPEWIFGRAFPKNGLERGFRSFGGDCSRIDHIPTQREIEVQSLINWTPSVFGKRNPGEIGIVLVEPQLHHSGGVVLEFVRPQENPTLCYLLNDQKCRVLLSSVFSHVVLQKLFVNN